MPVAGHERTCGQLKQALPVDPAHAENSAKLDDDFEDMTGRPLKAEKVVQKDEMACRRDWQEFRDALHGAQQGGNTSIIQVHERHPHRTGIAVALGPGIAFLYCGHLYGGSGHKSKAARTKRKGQANVR